MWSSFRLKCKRPSKICTIEVEPGRLPAFSFLQTNGHSRTSGFGKTSLGSFSGLVAELLVVLPSALISASERFFDLRSRILALNILESRIHLAGYLVELH